MTPHTEKFLRQRRFFMMLPVLVTPFLILLFWALGGGQGTSVQAAESKSGFNVEFPGAHFGKSEASLWDKFSLYEQAKKDSARYEEARRADPYYEIRQIVPSDTTPNGNGKLMTSLDRKDHGKEIQRQEAIINKRLEELSQYVNSPASPVNTPKRDGVLEPSTTRAGEPALELEAVNRLEKMMTIMSSSGGEDTEMKQIDQVLDKILRIQHPEMVAEDVPGAPVSAGNTARSASPYVEPDMFDQASTSASGDTIASRIGSVEYFTTTSAFYGIDDDSEIASPASNVIQAVVHETTTLVAGGTLKMRLLADAAIGGHILKKNAFIYGTCAIKGERITVTIKSVSIANSILPTAMSVYDTDGLEGIYIPGAISRDAAKQAASQSVQDVDLFSMNPSLGAQAAVAGVEAAKGLFSKKAKLVKVTVKAGYKIFLKDAGNRGM